MNPRTIAIHLRGLPRPVALSRPSAARAYPIIARNTPVSPRSYSAQASTAAESASPTPSGSEVVKSPEHDAAEKKATELGAKVKELEVSSA
jgi:hypothetical protein